MKKASPRQRSRKGLPSFGLACLLAMTAATAQMAIGAPGSTGIDASGSYRLESLACREGRTQQDRQTCLREARNAQAEKQRGQLESGTLLQRNAMARCEVFRDGEDKAACEARVMGYGSVSGSVAGGGLLREVETVVLPAGQDEITIEPRTADPVLLVPRARP